MWAIKVNLLPWNIRWENLLLWLDTGGNVKLFVLFSDEEVSYIVPHASDPKYLSEYACITAKYHTIETGRLRVYSVYHTWTLDVAHLCT